MDTHGVDKLVVHLHNVKDALRTLLQLGDHLKNVWVTVQAMSSLQTYFATSLLPRFDLDLFANLGAALARRKKHGSSLLKAPDRGS